MCTVPLPPGVNPIAFDKYINKIKNMYVDKNSSRENRVYSLGRTDRPTDRQTEADIAEILVAFLNFANAPKN
jgi:hypothetical protein